MGNMVIKICELLEMVREMFNGKVIVIYALEWSWEDYYEFMFYMFKPNFGVKYMINSHIDLG